MLLIYGTHFLESPLNLLQHSWEGCSFHDECEVFIAPYAVSGTVLRSLVPCLSESAEHRASNGWLDSPPKAPSKFQGTDKKLRSEELKEGDSSNRIKSLIRNQFSPSALLHPERGQSVGGWLIISEDSGNY